LENLNIPKPITYLSPIVGFICLIYLIDRMDKNAKNYIEPTKQFKITMLGVIASCFIAFGVGVYTEIRRGVFESPEKQTLELKKELEILKSGDSPARDQIIEKMQCY
jgi:high-affinity Fe2+/Pb2+ permease